MNEGQAMAFLKIGMDLMGAVFSAAVGVLAASDNTLITVTAISAVLGFAGLLVRQVVVAQKAIWEIVKAKEAEAEQAKDESHYLRWENDSIRFRIGERQVDPGPYITRRQGEA